MNFKVYLQKAKEQKDELENDLEMFLKDIPVDNVNEFKIIVREKTSESRRHKCVNVNIYFKN